MRSLSAAIQASIAGRLTSFALCWKITKNDGTILRGTEHDRDITIASGQFAGTYLAEFNITGSDIRSTSDLSVDNLEIDGAVEQVFGTTIRVADIESGVLDGASLVVFLVDWNDPDGGQVIVRAGYAGGISRDSNNKYKAEVRGLMQKLSQQIGQNYSEQCNVVRFGDERCKFDVASVTQACVVATVESRRRFTCDILDPTIAPLPIALPRGGEVTWSSGGNTGFTREVKTMTLVGSTFTIELYEESADDSLAGDLVDVIPGCDRLAPTCRFVYDNLVNFRGHGIFIPGALAIMRGNTIGECVVPVMEPPPVPPGEGGDDDGAEGGAGEGGGESGGDDPPPVFPEPEEPFPDPPPLPVQGASYEFPSGTDPTESGQSLTGEATFHCIGLYWSESTGSDSNEALVRFRPAGSTTWRQGLSLLWDNRAEGPDLPNAQANKIPYGFKQYRGSIVDLEPDTEYEIEVLTSGTRKFKSTTVTTWDEVFPEGTVVGQPTSSGSQLHITVGGSAGAYRVYEPSGSSATIDMDNDEDYAIIIDAPYVIVRGLTGKNTRRASIGITPDAHHFVIERCDLSKFGHKDPLSQYACNTGGGVETTQSGDTVNLGITHAVIQNNRVHDPNFDSNSWAEPDRPESPNCGPGKDGNHAAGATAFYFNNVGGHFVIRYNNVFSDLEHMFDDGIGGAKNFSFAGNLRRDSDVYENSFSHCWDDVYEIEGANMNVRVWGNYSEYGLVVMASMGCCSIGPAYVFRNVGTRGAKTPGASNSEGQGYKFFGKTVGANSNGPASQMTTAGGRIYLFHNTMTRLVPAEVGDGFIKNMYNGDQLGVLTVTSRNNIWHTRNSISSANIAIINGAGSRADFDYDLVGAGHTSWQSIEPHCIVADPVFDPAHVSGPWTQATTSPGVDAAVFIPNFNDRYHGAAPDMGAQERGAPRLRFGIRQ